MSHHGHPIIALGAIALAALFWVAHGKAQENNRFRTERTEIKAEVIQGFADLGISKRYYDLLLVQDDEKASLELLLISRRAGMARRFTQGEVVSVDRQERDVAEPYVCLRAVGEPFCYWTPALLSVQ